jgi:LuxR family transcriptional regulator, maltose regulon positive regulatory protein
LRLQKGIALGSIELERTIPGPSGESFALTEMPVICASGRKLLSAGKNEDAIALFRSYAGLARKKKQVRAFMKLTLLEAIANRQAGRQDQASALFETVLSLALFEDFKRIIIDEGQAAAGLINDIFSATSRVGTYRLRDRFLAELIVEIEAGLIRQDSVETILSPRETDIMRSVLSGRSNREIAEVLGISQNTVKFHLKNIFQKLNVSTRSEAINVCLRENVI